MRFCSGETTEEREARFQHLKSAQEQRIAVESTDEREARLQRVRSAQEQRIAAESTDERETRLQRVRSAQEAEDCCGVNGRERGPSSVSMECSGAEDRN